MISLARTRPKTVRHWAFHQTPRGVQPHFATTQYVRGAYTNDDASKTVRHWAFHKFRHPSNMSSRPFCTTTLHVWHVLPNWRFIPNGAPLGISPKCAHYFSCFGHFIKMCKFTLLAQATGTNLIGDFRRRHDNIDNASSQIRKCDKR